VLKRRPLTSYEVSILDAAAEIGFDRSGATAAFDNGRADIRGGARGRPPKDSPLKPGDEERRS
jgi:hypothetical protein